jgi:hypothetical protein
MNGYQRFVRTYIQHLHGGTMENFSTHHETIWLHEAYHILGYDAV